MTTVEVYDATALPDGASLATRPRRQVTVQSGWVVKQVLEAAGHSAFSGFCLVTPEIELDLRSGLVDEIMPATEMLGLDASGVAWFRDGSNLQWDDFVRAAGAHLYHGDPERVVVYPGGLGGGLPADGLLEAVAWLLDPGSPAVKAAASLAVYGATAGTLMKVGQKASEARKERAAQQWRQQGFTSPRICEYLQRLPQWDEQRFAEQTRLTTPEARLALTNAGYEPGADGLWRPGASQTAQEAAATLDAIRQRAEDNPEDNWLIP